MYTSEGLRLEGFESRGGPAPGRRGPGTSGTALQYRNRGLCAQIQILLDDRADFAILESLPTSGATPTPRGPRHRAGGASRAAAGLVPARAFGLAGVRGLRFATPTAGVTVNVK